MFQLGCLLSWADGVLTEQYTQCYDPCDSGSKTILNTAPDESCVASLRYRRHHRVDPNEVFSDSGCTQNRARPWEGGKGACSRKSSAFSHASVVDVVDSEDNITLTSCTRKIRSFEFSTTAFSGVTSVSQVEVTKIRPTSRQHCEAC